MTRFILIIIFILTIISCDSRKSAVKNVVVRDLININQDTLIGIWEVKGFNSPSGDVLMKTLDLNLDSTYIQFNDNQRFKFVNMPSLENNKLINGTGYWRMTEDNGQTVIRLKSNFDLTSIPLDSLYYVVNIEDVLTISHDMKSKNIALSFIKKKATNIP